MRQFANATNAVVQTHVSFWPETRHSGVLMMHVRAEPDQNLAHLGFLASLLPPKRGCLLCSCLP